MLLAERLCIACAGRTQCRRHAQSSNWDAVVREARGQTVYFNAWGGDLAINRYIDWARVRLREDYDLDLRHVKVS